MAGEPHGSVGPNQANMHRVTHLILDCNKTVIAVLLGQPREGWDEVHDGAVRRIKKTAARMGLDETTPHGRRGPYPSVAHGISYGGGQPASVILLILPILSDPDM
jgi:hypothetical protein